MAYKNKAEEKINAFKLMNTDVKEGNIPSVVLLCGKEQYLVQWSINMIINKYVNKATESLDITRIDSEKASVNAIIESCETLSMFSEKRVVILPDFTPLWQKNTKGFSEADEESLCEYIKDMPQGTILILTCNTPDKRRKLYRTIATVGKVYEFDTLQQKDLENFIVKRFKAADKICKTVVIEELITLSGYYHNEADYTLFNLENDLKKIIAHSKGQEIMPADVLSTVSGNMETNVFAMVDAMSRGRKDEAYRLLFNIIAAGENVYKLLSLIVSQFELILQVKELRSEGKNQDNIASILGIHPFRVKKAWSFGESYSVKSIKEILLKAYQVDNNIKTGLLEQNLALEMFIAQV